MRRFFLALIAILILTLPAVPAPAADTGRALTVIEPYGEGSIIDRVINILKPGLEKATGQAVNIVHGNTPGADAALVQLAAAPPDGNTVLVMDLLSMEVAEAAGSPALKLASLTPIAKLTTAGSVTLVVAESSPIKSWADFATAARGQSLKIAVPGPAASLPVALMERALGAHFTKVASAGRPATLAALSSGQADAGFLVTNTLLPGANPPPPTGIRLIVSFGAERNPTLKEVPTFQESVGPQSPDKRHNSITSVIVLFGPGNLPAAAVKRLDGALAAAAKSAIQGAEGSMPGGVPIVIGNAALLRETMARDARVIKEVLGQ